MAGFGSHPAESTAPFCKDGSVGDSGVIFGGTKARSFHPPPVAGALWETAYSSPSASKRGK